VEDDSLLRRGVPGTKKRQNSFIVAHKIYGIPQTINCANYVYFLALEKILKLNDPNLVLIFTESMIELHRGQGMELYWRDNGICPSESEYMDMVGNSNSYCINDRNGWII
jgi:geranylgeranyl diphosphate synthase type 3